VSEYTGVFILGAYLVAWLLLLLASRLTPLSKHVIFLREYWWLYIPLISWLFMVFPLVLPPIPLGPIALSLAWSRRRFFPFYRRGCEYLGKVDKQRGFPMGWLVNVWSNLLDMVTLGLAQLFATASLLREMIQRDGTEEERAEEDPATWVLKRLLWGNVFFIAAYIVCPGYLYAPLLVRMDKRYGLYGPVPVPSAEEVVAPSPDAATGEALLRELPTESLVSEGVVPVGARQVEKVVVSRAELDPSGTVGQAVPDDAKRRQRRTLIIVLAVIAVLVIICVACAGLGFLGTLLNLGSGR